MFALHHVALGSALLALLAAAACNDDGGDDYPDLPDAGSVADAAADAMVGPDADTRLRLSQTGLYEDIATLTVVADALEYTPAAALWSDGAVKRRWLLLPDGSTIDTTDMDHWRFPQGAKLFKEFAAPDGQRLETRLIEKTGTGDADTDFFMGAFVWLPDGSDAIFTPFGALDVLGTEHDVPTQTRCFTCHKGEPGKVLGFSAIQLSKDTAPHLLSPEVAVLLSTAPGADFRLTGTDVAGAAALTYLHANCGHCHNPEGTAHFDTCKETGMGNFSECMLLRLSVADAALTDLTQTGAALTLIGHTTNSFWNPGFPRLTPANPTMSAIHVRPNLRGSMEQMPPVYASEVVDATGVATVQTWIEGL